MIGWDCAFPLYIRCDWPDSIISSFCSLFSDRSLRLSPQILRTPFPLAAPPPPTLSLPPLVNGCGFLLLACLSFQPPGNKADLRHRGHGSPITNPLVSASALLGSHHLPIIEAQLIAVLICKRIVTIPNPTVARKKAKMF